MNQPKIILLCSTRLAFQAMHVMLFLKQLRVVVIPEHADEMVDNTKMLLRDTGVPVVTVNARNFSQKITGLISRHEIDLGFIISFAFRLPSAVYTLTRFGFYNVHPGPLPSYRGPDPVFHQIVNREKLAGISIHKLDDDYDTGPVVMTEMITLDPADTHGILTEKLSVLASRMVTTFLKLLSLTTDIPARPQDESNAIYYKKQGLAETIINWKVMKAGHIIALINACNPWNKGAITKLNTKIIRIVEAVEEDSVESTEQGPGTILAIKEKGILISTSDKKVICARIIYVEEGFLPSQRLAQFGIRSLMQFSQISN